MEKGEGSSRNRKFGRLNEVYNVERMGDIYLNSEMEFVKFIQVSGILSVVKSSEPTFPCLILACPSYLAFMFWAERGHGFFFLDYVFVSMIPIVFSVTCISGSSFTSF